MKKGIIIAIILILIGIQLLLLAIFSSQDPDNPNIFYNIAKTITGENQNENPQENTTTGYSSSNGDDSQQNQTSNTDTNNCYLIQAPYSLEQTSGDGENDTICELELRNLDYDIEGEFAINFTIKNSNEEIIKNELQTKTIQPREKVSFSIDKQFNEGCEYKTIIPKKQACD